MNVASTTGGIVCISIGIIIISRAGMGVRHCCMVMIDRV